MYVSAAAVCALVSLALGWTAYASRFNGSFYDLYFRQRGPRSPSNDAVLVVIDDETLARYGALPLDRSVLAEGIRVIEDSGPSLLAVDLLLSDVSGPDADGELRDAFAGPVPLILSTAMEASPPGRWLNPLPGFVENAAAVAHVHADPDSDGVMRRVLLEKRVGRERRWALGLECVRLWLGMADDPVTETDEALAIPRSVENFLIIPAPRAGERALLINYAGGNDTFPQIGFENLLRRPELRPQLSGKIVLIGVTAQGAGDRLFTPFSAGVGMPGVEIHANLLHTLLTEQYLRPAGDLPAALAIFGIAAFTAWGLWRFHGLRLVAVLIAFGAAVFLLPYRLFLAGSVWPSFSLLLPFGVTLAVCGTWQLFRARRQLDRSEAQRRRSQQQWQMAAHEIRTPLTAIQGSSELLLRYPLDDSRREQMIRLISEESERLGKLVERFLSVERLSAGEMELRRAPLDLPALLSAVAERIRPAAERRGVHLVLSLLPEDSAAEMEGDAELLDFAVSNLVTNAVKYSPAGTSVTLSLERQDDQTLVHVADQGPGMTAEESRRIFDRFYRTEAAETSANPGFGLGLAIAREIASHHGGDLRVESKPGAGSRFTLALPAVAPARQPRQPSR